MYQNAEISVYLIPVLCPGKIRQLPEDIFLPDFSVLLSGIIGLQIYL